MPETNLMITAFSRSQKRAAAFGRRPLSDSYLLQNSSNITVLVSLKLMRGTRQYKFLELSSGKNGLDQLKWSSRTQAILVRRR